MPQGWLHAAGSLSVHSPPPRDQVCRGHTTSRGSSRLLTPLHLPGRWPYLSRRSEPAASPRACICHFIERLGISPLAGARFLVVGAATAATMVSLHVPSRLVTPASAPARRRAGGNQPATASPRHVAGREAPRCHRPGGLCESSWEQGREDKDWRCDWRGLSSCHVGEDRRFRLVHPGKCKRGAARHDDWIPHHATSWKSARPSMARQERGRGKEMNNMSLGVHCALAGTRRSPRSCRVTQPESRGGNIVQPSPEKGARQLSPRQK